MRHSGFWATGIMILALFGFAGSSTALAAYSTSPEFSMERPLAAAASERSFTLAKAGDKKASQKNSPKKEEEEGFFSKTLKSLVGDDDKKKKSAGKKDGKKEEEGFFTETLKTLVGKDDDKAEKKAKKKRLNPMEVAPTASATKEKEKFQPTTAKTETKATLKDSFSKLVDLGESKDKGGSSQEGDPSGKKKEKGLLSKYLGGGDKKDKPAAGKPVKGTLAKETKEAKITKEAKKDEGGLLDSILGGGDKKKDQTTTKQVKVEKKVNQPAPGKKPRKLTAKQTLGDEEKQLEKDRGGTEKGKNVLKESFKSLLKKDAEKEK